jgi:hypothetical protein
MKMSWESFNQPSEIGRLKSPYFSREEMPTVDTDLKLKGGRLSCMESAALCRARLNIQVIVNIDLPSWSAVPVQMDFYKDSSLSIRLRVSKRTREEGSSWVTFRRWSFVFILKFTT